MLAVRTFIAIATCMKTSFSVFFFSSVLAAQSLTFGIKGGGFFTEPAERFDQSKRYVAGVSIEVGLPGNFAVEGNGLYSRFGSSLGTGTLASGRIRGHAGEFPVLGKYYFADTASSVRPFASSGFAFRKIWFDNNIRFASNRRGSGFADSEDIGVGAVFGGGVAIKAWRLSISPEFRYTRWGGSNYPATNPNQAQALIGITF